MTDNEIIKALECCGEIDGKYCDTCAYQNENDCVISLARNALDLINRQKVKEKELQEKVVIQRGLIDHQKADIKRLKDLIISNDEENLSYVAAAIKEKRELIQIEHTRILKAEIERLENKLFDAKQSIGFYKANFMAKCEEIDKAKSEAIKEFAKRLKEEYPADGRYRENTNIVIRIFHSTIDNLVKEMVGEQE